MPDLPRVITHRPDTLRLRQWAYRDGQPDLAEPLDVSFATGRDWHDPALVLVDVDALDLFEVLYGRREGCTVAVACTTVEAAAAQQARAAGRCDAVLHLASRASRAATLALLEEHAIGDNLLRTALSAIRPGRPDPLHLAPVGRPRLTLVHGGALRHTGPATVQEDSQ